MIKHLVLILFILLSPVVASSSNIDELIEMLKSEDNLTRLEASGELLKLGTSVDSRLLKLLSEERDEVKRSVVWILGEWGEKRYVVHLIPLLGGDHELAKTIILALGKIGDPETVPYLVEKLKSESRYIRTNAALALGSIGEQSTLIYLINLINDPDWHVREAVAIAMGKMGNPLAVEYLKKIAINDSDPVVSIAAEEALESIGF
ncbi:MAG: HEAT repeat domain-containing protein [Thermodesulfobacteriota bacterium]